MHCTLVDANSSGADAQPKTALAETPGSKFAADCRNLLDEGRTDQFIARLVSQVDLIYSKANEKGRQPAAGVGAAAHWAMTQRHLHRCILGAACWTALELRGAQRGAITH